MTSGAAVDDYLASEGVDYAVGLAEVCPGVSGVTTNEFVWERYRDSKRLFLFASINPHLDADPAGEVHRWADRGFRGLKLYPTYQHVYTNDPKLWPMYEACAEQGLPLESGLSGAPVRRRQAPRQAGGIRNQRSANPVELGASQHI